MFKILDMHQNNVGAAASFGFKGWTVSMSTILKPHNVLIWKDGEEDRAFNTVELAIIFITDKEVK